MMSGLQRRWSKVERKVERFLGRTIGRPIVRAVCENRCMQKTKTRISAVRSKIAAKVATATKSAKNGKQVKDARYAGVATTASGVDATEDPALAQELNADVIGNASTDKAEKADASTARASADLPDACGLEADHVAIDPGTTTTQEQESLSHASDQKKDSDPPNKLAAHLPFLYLLIFTIEFAAILSSPVHDYGSTFQSHGKINLVVMLLIAIPVILLTLPITLQPTRMRKWCVMAFYLFAGGIYLIVVLNYWMERWWEGVGGRILTRQVGSGSGSCTVRSTIPWIAAVPFRINWMFSGTECEVKEGSDNLVGRPPNGKKESYGEEVEYVDDGGAQGGRRRLEHDADDELFDADASHATEGNPFLAETRRDLRSSTSFAQHSFGQHPPAVFQMGLRNRMLKLDFPIFEFDSTGVDEVVGNIVASSSSNSKSTNTTASAAVLQPLLDQVSFLQETFLNALNSANHQNPKPLPATSAPALPTCRLEIFQTMPSRMGFESPIVARVGSTSSTDATDRLRRRLVQMHGNVGGGELVTELDVNWGNKVTVKGSDNAIYSNTTSSASAGNFILRSNFTLILMAEGRKDVNRNFFSGIPTELRALYDHQFIIPAATSASTTSSTASVTAQTFLQQQIQRWKSHLATFSTGNIRSTANENSKANLQIMIPSIASSEFANIRCSDPGIGGSNGRRRTASITQPLDPQKIIAGNHLPVIVLVIDTISRSEGFRKLPKTMQVLEEIEERGKAKRARAERKWREWRERNERRVAGGESDSEGFNFDNFKVESSKTGNSINTANPPQTNPILEKRVEGFELFHFMRHHTTDFGTSKNALGFMQGSGRNTQKVRCPNFWSYSEARADTNVTNRISTCESKMSNTANGNCTGIPGTGKNLTSIPLPLRPTPGISTKFESPEMNETDWKRGLIGEIKIVSSERRDSYRNRFDFWKHVYPSGEALGHIPSTELEMVDDTYVGRVENEIGEWNRKHSGSGDGSGSNSGGSGTSSSSSSSSDNPFQNKLPPLKLTKSVHKPNENIKLSYPEADWGSNVHEVLKIWAEPDLLDRDEPFGILNGGPFSAVVRCLKGRLAHRYQMDMIGRKKKDGSKEARTPDVNRIIAPACNLTQTTDQDSDSNSNSTRFSLPHPISSPETYPAVSNFWFLEAHEATRGVVDSLDPDLASLFLDLESSGTLEEAAVVLLSDHGNHLGL